MQIFSIGTGSVNYGTAIWYNNRMPENVCYVCTCLHACVKKIRLWNRPLSIPVSIYIKKKEEKKINDAFSS